jgi:hypothetical protein
MAYFDEKLVGRKYHACVPLNVVCGKLTNSKAKTKSHISDGVDAPVHRSMSARKFITSLIYCQAFYRGA